MTSREFYKKWLNHFAKDISEIDKEKYIVSTGNYLWHVFSWKLLDENSFLVGDDAKAAYDEVDIAGALYLEWFKDDEAKVLSCELYTADALDQMTEVYVVASDFSWTYMKTHESMCGPYFVRL